MECYCFFVGPNRDVDSAQTELEELGIVILYSDVTPEKPSEIYAQVPAELPMDQILVKCPSIDRAVPCQLPEIDWEQQWNLHGSNFHEGCVHIDLSPYGISKELLLEPGAGFGDFSHPTTRMSLLLLSNRVKDRYVIDIGSRTGY